MISPLTITYTHPLERCLFNAARDVNPFSLLYEACWTLAGRDDVASISYYTPRMADYSDDGVRWHGAYGCRWRRHFGGDQLDAAVRALRADGHTRRVVLEMWDPRCDLLDPPEGARDLPCNTHCYLDADGGRLDLTVCNRSNDIVWGTLGANYVVFSCLLEYVAARVGVPAGEYHQFSANAHAYSCNWKPAEWLADTTPDLYTSGHTSFAPETGEDRVPLVKDPAAFEAELPLLVEQYGGGAMETPFREYTEPFLRTVAQPAFDAFLTHRRKGATTLDHAARIADPFWRAACSAWLTRRRKGVTT